MDHFDSQMEEAQFLTDRPMSFGTSEEKRTNGRVVTMTVMMTMVCHSGTRLKWKRFGERMSKDGHLSLFQKRLKSLKTCFFTCEAGGDNSCPAGVT